MIALRIVTLVATLTIVSVPALSDEGKDESGKGKNERSSQQHKHEGNQGRVGDSYFHRNGYTRLDIPPGHYPPPGECRIWYPGRPPGHQPPPFKCGMNVPEGAWLIQHPARVADRVHVTVYEAQHPGRVLAIGEFNIASGAFVRVLFNR